MGCMTVECHRIAVPRDTENTDFPPGNVRSRGENIGRNDEGIQEIQPQLLCCCCGREGFPFPTTIDARFCEIRSILPLNGGSGRAGVPPSPRFICALPKAM